MKEEWQEKRLPRCLGCGEAKSLPYMDTCFECLEKANAGQSTNDSNVDHTEGKS